PPTFKKGEAATCLGGGEWAVSAFSKNKAAAAKLVRYLAGPEAARYLAIHAALLPALPELYDDPDLLRGDPWLTQAKAALLAARTRPATRRYPEAADTIAGNFNAALTGVKTVSDAIADMQ